jgi:hypothetical protein
VNSRFKIGAHSLPSASLDDQLRHRAILGATGSGKTFWTITQQEQGIRSPYSAVSIDPHGDYHEHIFNRQILKLSPHATLAAKSYRAQDRQDHWGKIEEFVDNTIVIDLSDPRPKWVVCLNPLERLPGEDPERKARALSNMVIKLWNDDPLIVVRMRRVLFHAFLALIELKYTLLELQRWLTDSDFRKKRIPKLSYPALRDFWKYEYPKSPKMQQDWAGPSLNRLGEFVQDPVLRSMVSSRYSSLNWVEFFAKGGNLFVNADAEALGGSDNVRLAAGFILFQIQSAAASRPEGERPPVLLFLDECQYYGTNLADGLAGARKFGLSYSLATQWFTELTPQVQQGVLNTVGSLVVFQTGAEDARKLAPELFPGHPEASQILQTLDQRYFVYKRRGPAEAMLIRSFEEPKPILTEDEMRLKEFVLEQIGARWGRGVGEIEEEARQRYRTGIIDLGYGEPTAWEQH